MKNSNLTTGRVLNQVIVGLGLTCKTDTVCEGAVATSITLCVGEGATTLTPHRSVKGGLIPRSAAGVGYRRPIAPHVSK